MLKKINKWGAVEAQSHAFVCTRQCMCVLSLYINACVVTASVCTCALTPTEAHSSPACNKLFYSIIKNPTDPGGTPIEKPISFPFRHPKHSSHFFSHSQYPSPSKHSQHGRMREKCVSIGPLLQMSRCGKHQSKQQVFQTSMPIP